MTLADDILNFWYEPGEPRIRQDWFQRSDTFDQEIRDRFFGEYERAVAGDHDALAATPRGALALIIMLDQFPRNLFRDDARAYATDAKAMSLAATAVGQGHDAELNWMERLFLYMPYQHAEDLVLQERSVALFTSLANADSLQSAIKHHDIVKRFGRFPHRNQVLGRPSTPDEVAFLAEHGRGF